MSFKWDQAKEDAAALIAVGELTKDEISDRVGVTRPTLYNWLSKDEFAARVEENRKDIRDRILTTEIADLLVRLRRYNKRYQQIDRLIEERGKAREMMNVPGGRTGLLAHEQKSLGSGDLATVVDVYKFDSAIVKEERELAKQAAIELGQWQEKTDVTSGGKPFEPVIFKLPDNGRD